MECPKCNAQMKEHSVRVLHGTVVIDQCNSCHGLWFDNGEAEELKSSWMSDFLDSLTLNMKTVRNTACSWMPGNLQTTSMRR